MADGERLREPRLLWSRGKELRSWLELGAAAARQDALMEQTPLLPAPRASLRRAAVGTGRGRGASLGIFQGNGRGCNASARIFSLASAPFFFLVPCGSLAEGTVSHCLFLLLFSSFLIASSLGLLPNSLL